MELRYGKERIVCDGGGTHIRVGETAFWGSDGVERRWQWIEPRHSVCIFPITPAQKAVLIKNDRVPLRAPVLELPAGLKDKPRESEAEAARRELAEETGYHAARL